MDSMHYDTSFETDKKTALRAAKELCYSEDVKRRLKRAKTKSELERILATAREEENY